VPETETENEADAPEATVVDEGCDVIVGAVTVGGGGAIEMLSVAALEVTEPAALLTTTVYRPASIVATVSMVNVEFVAPEIAAPFFCHWYLRVAEPDAVTEKEALSPEFRERALG